MVKADFADGKVLKPDFKPAKELFTTQADLRKAKYSADGCTVEFDQTFTYDQPGTYFAAVRVMSQRKGDLKDKYTLIENLDRVRIVVK